VGMSPAMCASGVLEETLDKSGQADGVPTPIDLAALLK
jgi:hypothetical protein